MYARETSKETRTDALLEAMRDIKLCAMVSATANGLQASHVPVLVEQRDDDGIILKAHLSRNNSHWRAIAEPTPTVAIFQGAHSYISPSWYKTKQETGKVVPTWGYVVVHAHGSLDVIDDADWLRAHVSALTDLHEAGRAAPWAVSDAPDKYITAMLRGIIGIQLTVDRLEGSWKLNQHRTDADQAGAIDGLAAEADPVAQALGKVMQLTKA